MSLRLGSRLLAVAAPAALLLPTVAHAEKVVTDDAVADARSYTVDWESEQEPEFVLAPDEVSTDIVRTVAAHGVTRLRVTVHFRDLQTTRPQMTFIKVFSPGRAYQLVVEKVPGSSAVAGLSTRADDVECRGLRAKVDGGEDMVTVSVPTACIDAPRWVQLGVGAIGFELPADGQDVPFETVFADDGHRGTISDNSIGRGPRIHRG